MDHVVDLHDVRVAQAGGGPRLAKGTPTQFLPFVFGHSDREGDLLDRDLAPQYLVVGQPDPSHPADTEATAEPVPFGDRRPVKVRNRPVITAALREHQHPPAPPDRFSIVFDRWVRIIRAVSASV